MVAQTLLPYQRLLLKRPLEHNFGLQSAGESTPVPGQTLETILSEALT